LSRRMARLERKDKRMSVVRVLLLLGLGFLALGLVYRLSINTISTVSKLNRDVKVAEYGTMEDKLSGPAIVLNKEDIVPAVATGHFDNMAKDQEKISKGALLGYFVTAQGQIPLRAQESGTFMRKTDGLESVFSNMDLKAVTPEVFKYKTTEVKEDQPVLAGQPLYKIVDSLEPTRLLVHFPLDKINFDIKPGQQVKILLGGKELGNAVILDTRQDFGELLLMVKFKGFQEELLQQRFVEVEVVFNTYSGYLIPEKALIEKDGKKGIYCSNGEDITFKPVNIIKTKDGIDLVEGLKQNDMIVTNPPE
jgi:putative membrane fusion protein